jgi:hypothetical protein
MGLQRGAALLQEVRRQPEPLPRQHLLPLGRRLPHCPGKLEIKLKGSLHEATDCRVAGDTAPKLKTILSANCRLLFVDSCRAKSRDMKFIVRLNRPYIFNTDEAAFSKITRFTSACMCPSPFKCAVWHRFLRVLRAIELN